MSELSPQFLLFLLPLLSLLSLLGLLLLLPYYPTPLTLISLFALSLLSLLSRSNPQGKRKHAFVFGMYTLVGVCDKHTLEHTYGLLEDNVQVLISTKLASTIFTLLAPTNRTACTTHTASIAPSVPTTLTTPLQPYYPYYSCYLYYFYRCCLKR